MSTLKVTVSDIPDVKVGGRTAEPNPYDEIVESLKGRLAGKAVTFEIPDCTSETVPAPTDDDPDAVRVHPAIVKMRNLLNKAGEIHNVTVRVHRKVVDGKVMATIWTTTRIKRPRKTVADDGES